MEKNFFGRCTVERTCGFFGHKDTPESVKDDLYAAIEKLIVECGVDTFYIGNQGHFDFYARAVLRQLQGRYPIQYSVVLAYIHGKKTEYDDFSDTILPEGIEEVHPKYAISWRNDWLPRQSNFVIAYIHHNWGGAARYVQKAYRQGKTVINLCKDSYFDGGKTK